MRCYTLASARTCSLGVATRRAARRRLDAMNQLEVFLREHAGVHSKEAVPADFNMDWMLADLSDAQLRARPHGLNSIAWLLWHVARVEDSCVSLVVCGKPQLLDDAWVGRLRGAPRGDGEGMSKDEVAALSAAIDLDALRAYRNEVGRRTRAQVAELWPDRWHVPFTVEDLQLAAERGALSGDEPKWLIGRPREFPLLWWGLHHTHYHLGQAAMLRGILVANPA